MLQLLTKSYRNDFPWLRIAVRSVQHFCKEPLSWTVVVEQADSGELTSQPWAKQLRVVIAEELWPEIGQIPAPYVRQQWIKMNAFRIMNGYFWNWDSDVHARKEFTSENFKSASGNPIWWVSEYNNLMSPNHAAIFNARRDLLKRTFFVPEIPLEFMRCMPIPSHSDILRQASTRDEWRRYFDAMKGDNNAVSEFNAIGLFAQINYPWMFDWKNAETTPGGTWGAPDGIVNQSWSYGGVPNELNIWADGLT